MVVDQLGDDMSHQSKAKKGIDWWYELEQTETGLGRVKSWAEGLSSRLSDEDIFIHSNTDEVITYSFTIIVLPVQVLARTAIHSLAHCAMAATTATGALWMPMGNPTNAFKTDCQVSGRPHSICMPAIYTWGAVRRGEQKGGHYYRGSKNR